MKRTVFILLVCQLFSKTTLCQANETTANSEFLSSTNQWFNAWQLLSKEIYQLPSLHPVDLVFFDSQYVYSTATVTVPGAAAIDGPSLMGNSYTWKKAMHNGFIILPDSSKVPVGLMSFAGENKLNSKAFFVMPLPSFWKSAGVTSKELGFENLLTGVFLHEFSHSQQAQNFGKKITEFEGTTNFGTDLSDDIVQDIFKKDSSYTRIFISEVSEFYKAAREKDVDKLKGIVQHALVVMELRQSKHFKDQYLPLKQIDDFFLTMEGIGQYSMYAWLIHPKGANLPREQVITGVRRGKTQWSQDQGFALFLLLEKFASPEKWAPGLFSTETTAVKYLLTKYISAH